LIARTGVQDAGQAAQQREEKGAPQRLPGLPLGGNCVHCRGDFFLVAEIVVT
jgi:hypothetical protein